VNEQTYSFQFVEFMPKILDDGVLYISTTYATACHRCFCGCGMKVVTPLSPTDWQLTFDGDTVSLHPSIGNWSYPCRSHYILEGNRVMWAEPMSSEEIQSIRDTDTWDKKHYYAQRHRTPLPKSMEQALTSHTSSGVSGKASSQGWRRLLSWFQ
jgi:hypothetical protein